MTESPDNSELKTKTAGALKWNVVDRIASQMLYAVTGIILARELTQEDFGLVGAILVFQAFANLFVDSGFASALIQRKSPSRLDYSTVLWFNIAVAVIIYLILYISAPIIDELFNGAGRLIPLSRVMFLSFILNAAGIVQANRLTKQMNVMPIAATNAAGLAAGAIVGIYLAVSGFGAWSIVWQTITTNGVKTMLLWFYSRWLPLLNFSFSSLKSFFNVGVGVMATSFLNVFFQNIYSFIIGNRIGLAPLGYYTQADKWSKMGIASLSQTVTASFLPTLSSVQDDFDRFKRVVTKMNRFTAYTMFPSLLLLVAMSTPIFHVLFGIKWDAAIILFQILLIRGIFTIYIGLYNNYIIALAKSHLIVCLEIMRDVSSIIALIATWSSMTISTTAEPVMGLRIMLYGQLAASFITCIATIIITAPLTGHRPVDYLIHMAPYALISTVIAIIAASMSTFISNQWLLLVVQATTGISLYLFVNHILNSNIQREVLSFVFHNFAKRT